MTITSVGLLLIPKLEQWRLLYMVPLEILAALGLIHALASAGLLKQMTLADTESTGWLQESALIGSLVAGGTLLTANLAPPLALVLALPLIGWLLAHGMSHDQLRQITAAEISLLYSGRHRQSSLRSKIAQAAPAHLLVQARSTSLELE